jgi:hypothetical protein
LQHRSKFVRKQPIIRRLLTGLLLALFALSGTPKIFVHDLVAQHKDTRCKFSHGSHTDVERATFTCHTEDLVVESPFITSAALPGMQVPVICISNIVELTARLYAFFPVRYSLRGPPALS